MLLGSPIVLAANFNRRMKDLKEKLDTGDALRIAEIVRDMYRSYHANELIGRGGRLPGERVTDRPDGLSPAGWVQEIVLGERTALQDFGCFGPEDPFAPPSR